MARRFGFVKVSNHPSDLAGKRVASRDCALSEEGYRFDQVGLARDP